MRMNQFYTGRRPHKTEGRADRTAVPAPAREHPREHPREVRLLAPVSLSQAITS